MNNIKGWTDHDYEVYEETKEAMDEASNSEETEDEPYPYDGMR